MKNDFRNENEHMHQNYEFQSAELEILDANGENTIGAIDMKKGEKYIVQIDLHEELVTGYEEMGRFNGSGNFQVCTPYWFKNSRPDELPV